MSFGHIYKYLITAGSEWQGARSITRVFDILRFTTMEQPVSEPLSGENGRPLDEVQRQVSDQLDRELRQDKINEHDQSLYRQQTVSLSISPNYVKQWDTTAAFRELYQNW